MIGLLATCAILVIALIVAFYLLGKVPVGEPGKTIIEIVVVIIIAAIAIYILQGYATGPPIMIPH